MATPTVYVICDANCKWEGMTKEQILTAITQAVNNSNIGDIDTGFVQTIKTINGIGLRFFVGTQAQYNALSADAKQNLFAIITDDAAKENIETLLNSILDDINSINNRITEEKKAEQKKFDAIDNRLNKMGLMPTLNTSKQLLTMGYYYIYAEGKSDWSGEDYCFGAIYYNPMQIGKLYFAPIGGKYADTGYANKSDGAAVSLEINEDGEMRILKASNITNLTDKFDIYTGLIAGV
jgi:hypothetical protein